jgi:CHAT domain-containing protein
MAATFAGWSSKFTSMLVTQKDHARPTCLGAFRLAVTLAAVATIVPASVLCHNSSYPLWNAQQIEESIELRPSQAIVEDITLDRPHQYWFESRSGDLFKLAVEQRDLKLRVIVSRPDGSELVQQLISHSGLTTLVSRADQPGRYRITVESQSREVGARQLSLCLEQQAMPSFQRSAGLRAAKALLTGDALASQWTQMSLDRAIDQYRQAQHRWRLAGDLRNCSAALAREAEIEGIRGNFGAALLSYRVALALLKNNSPRDKADILIALADLSVVFSHFDEGQKYALLAERLSASVHYHVDEAFALTELGAIAFYREDPARAESYLKVARSLWTGSPDERGEALTSVYTSYLRLRESDYASALQSLKESLRHSRSIGDSLAEGRTLADMGNYYLHVDELERARRSYNDSLYLLTRAGATHEEGYVLDDVGAYLDRTGDPASYQLYRRAASIAKDLRDDLLYAEILSDLSRAALLTGRTMKALEYSRQERSITSRIGNGILISQALRNTGEIYVSMGRVNSAMAVFKSALSPTLLDSSSADRACGQIELARTLEQLNRMSEAFAVYDAAARMSHLLQSARTEADARYHIARLQMKRGLLNEALVEIEQAIRLIESLRPRVSADQTRVWWFANFHTMYELYIDVLMQLHSVEGLTELERRAFEIAERSTARSLVEVLNQAQLDRSTTQAAAMELAAVRRMLADKTQEQVRLLAGPHNPAAVNRVALEIGDLNGRETELEALLPPNGPTYGTGQTEPLGVGQAQSLLGDDDVIVEYFLGSTHSYLWVITRTEFSSHILPPRSDIEWRVRKLRSLITLPPRGPLRADVADQAHKSDQETELTVARELGEMLLGPAASVLRKRRIVVAADGVLQYLPFGALVVPFKADAPSSERLIESHEVISLPSVTSLAILRSRGSSSRPVSRGVVVFADPVFEGDDPRIQASPKDVNQALIRHGNDEIATSVTTRSPVGGRFPRLPGTRREATVIEEVSAAEGANIALGFEASRSRATDTEIGRYRIVHFATHSVFDDEHPESSAIILSLYDSRGNPQDGYLRLRDIYNLNLSAELVVLSACESALGKDIKGEGVVGLTRGFMNAGAPRVVATLWKVDDDATSEFMKWFYAGIMEKHESAAASLRQAQMVLRKQDRWHSPYYWAGFVLEGEWR